MVANGEDEEDAESDDEDDESDDEDDESDDEDEEEPTRVRLHLYLYTMYLLFMMFEL